MDKNKLEDKKKSAEEELAYSIFGNELYHCDKMLQDDWQREYNYAGSFQTALMRAIECADIINLTKLRFVYPETVNSFIKFQKGGGE